jgi:hypothetical protein
MDPSRARPPIFKIALSFLAGHSFISNRQRRGKKARNVRRGKVGIEPRTFRVPSPARCQLHCHSLHFLYIELEIALNVEQEQDSRDSSVGV